jgi:hypothetical protein
MCVSSIDQPYLCLSHRERHETPTIVTMDVNTAQMLLRSDTLRYATYCWLVACVLAEWAPNLLNGFFWRCWLCSDCVLIVFWLLFSGAHCVLTVFWKCSDCADCVLIVFWLCSDCVLIVFFGCWLCSSGADCVLIVFWLRSGCVLISVLRVLIVFWLCSNCVLVVLVLIMFLGHWLCSDGVWFECECAYQADYDLERGVPGDGRAEHGGGGSGAVACQRPLALQVCHRLREKSAFASIDWQNVLLPPSLSSLLRACAVLCY